MDAVDWLKSGRKVGKKLRRSAGNAGGNDTVPILVWRGGDMRCSEWCSSSRLLVAFWLLKWSVRHQVRAFCLENVSDEDLIWSSTLIFNAVNHADSSHGVRFSSLFVCVFLFFRMISVKPMLLGSPNLRWVLGRVQVQDRFRKHVLRFRWTGPNHPNVKSRSHKHKNMADNYRRNIVFSVLLNELHSSLDTEEQFIA